jgi:penicillin amidase
MAFGKYGAAANLFCRLALKNARPHPTRSLQERLAMLPLKGAPVSRPVTICWDDHQIPFIEAQTDEDLAAALGIVHAHLRLGQMELMRRLAQGRVSEMAGRFGLDLDRLIRTFDIGRAVPQILAAMPAETRTWLAGFARGINHCLDHAPERPREFAVLDLKRESWSIADVVMLGRLIAADVNWIVWLRLLKFRASPDWPQLWRRLLHHDTLSFQSGNGAGAISDSAKALTGGALRSGSNSLAVAAARSESGGALIASDPHLSITLPNPWLLAGMKSPSHHAVGRWCPESLHRHRTQSLDRLGRRQSPRCKQRPGRGAARRLARRTCRDDSRSRRNRLDLARCRIPLGTGGQRSAGLSFQRREIGASLDGSPAERRIHRDAACRKSPKLARVPQRF